MTITASQVRELRDLTGAGMMNCKEALKETGGDYEAAVDFLRKKGLKSADKKASRATSEGRVFATLDSDGKGANLVSIHCETDFVARTPEFEALLDSLCAHVQSEKPADAAEMLEQSWAAGGNVGDAIKETVGKLGENMLLAGAGRLECTDGWVGSYIHHTNKVGAIAAIRTSKGQDEVAETLKNLCMHCAANDPSGLSRDEVPEAAVEREKAIYMDEVKNKPEEIQEKIMAGKLNKFFAGICLNEQPWIWDDKSSTKAAVQAALGDEAEIVGFIRFQIGE
jgi:elongation factor Ts